MPTLRNTTHQATRPLTVPRAGVEPARVAPLVFETSASTDSAIWAAATASALHLEVNAVQRYTYFSNYQIFFIKMCCFRAFFAKYSEKQPPKVVCLAFFV